MIIRNFKYIKYNGLDGASVIDEGVDGHFTEVESISAKSSEPVLYTFWPSFLMVVALGWLYTLNGGLAPSQGGK